MVENARDLRGLECIILLLHFRLSGSPAFRTMSYYYTHHWTSKREFLTAVRNRSAAILYVGRINWHLLNIELRLPVQLNNFEPPL
jgi:hypothetical protein